MSRIALLLPDLEMGGAQRVMLLLARQFSSRGHHVELVLLSSAGPLLADVPDTVKIIDLSSRNYGLGGIGFLLSSVQRLSRWMSRSSPDVLLSTITGANLVALLAKRKSGASMRLVIREAVTLKNISSVLRLKAMRWLYPQADAVVALSPVMAKELIGSVGVSERLVHCISNPIDTHVVNQQAEMPVDDPWLSDKDYKVIISVGRLIEQKDYATLLRAFALLSSALSARLMIVGEGPERSKLESLAVELGVFETVRFVGFDANPWRWMARADLYVLSSRWEGHPNTLLEALALDLPIVSTAYDDSVKELATCYGFTVVPPGREEILAEAIKDQLGTGYRASYQMTDEVGHVVRKYLDVLGCVESPLSRTALDHETATTAE